MNWEYITSGAFVGLLGGGVVGFAMSEMKKKEEEGNNVGNVSNLQADSQLAELVSRFKPLAKHEPEMQTLYDSLVESCDKVLECYLLASESQSRGAIQFKANRHAYAAKQNANKLCKKAFSEYKDQLGPELQNEVSNIEALLNNHLHNMLIT